MPIQLARPGPQGPQGATGPAGADGATGPQGPQGPAGSGGSPTVFERTLGADASAGASTITVDVSPHFAAQVGFIVIDPYTIQAELRRVSNVSGTTLTLSGGNLVYAHTTGDRVLFVNNSPFQPLEWWGLTAGQDISVVLQTALDAVRPSSVNRNISIPMGQYRADSTVYVPSDSWIKGATGYGGTTISVNGDFVLLDARGGSPPHTSSSTKTHTRVIIHSLNFIRQTNTTSSAYTIDISGDSSMCEVGWCHFGDNTNGCLNGIRGDGSATWIHHCRFLRINDSTVAGQTDPKGSTYPASAGDGAAIKMADATGTTTSMTIESCQFERQAKILLLNVRGFHIHDCHFESSLVSLQNSCDNVFRDNYMITSSLLCDQMSNDNTFQDITGRTNRRADYGSNTYVRADFKGIGRNVQGFGPFHRDTSPIEPAVVGTTNSSYPQVTWGSGSTTVLFAVKLMAPKNQSSNASTVVFKNANGGATLHTSPSITLTSRVTAGATARDTDTFIESYTYWVPIDIPASGSVYIETSHRYSVWAAKCMTAHSILDSPADISNWGASASSGFATSATGATATHTTGQYRVNFTANTAWSIRQLFPWPSPHPKRVLMILKGRWTNSQTIELSATAEASDGSDIQHTRAQWKAEDAAFWLQDTDKVLMLVTDMWTISGSGVFGMAFGGAATDWPSDNTEIQIEWAAAVPL